MKQSKINRGLGLFGLALLVIPEDDIAGTELRITTHRAFRNNDVAHWGWSLLGFAFYSTVLIGALFIPGSQGAFDATVTVADLSEMVWFCFVWLLWLAMNRA